MLTNHRFGKITARGYNPSLSFLLFSIIISLGGYNYYPYYIFTYYSTNPFAIVHFIQEYS